MPSPFPPPSPRRPGRKKGKPHTRTHIRQVLQGISREAICESAFFYVPELLAETVLRPPLHPHPPPSHPTCWRHHHCRERSRLKHLFLRHNMYVQRVPPHTHTQFLKKLILLATDQLAKWAGFLWCVQPCSILDIYKPCSKLCLVTSVGGKEIWLQYKWEEGGCAHSHDVKIESEADKVNTFALAYASAEIHEIRALKIFLEAFACLLQRKSFLSQLLTCWLSDDEDAGSASAVVECGRHDDVLLQH